MKFFEHKVVYLADAAQAFHESQYAGVAEVNMSACYEGALDKFGDQGWELYSITAVPERNQPDSLVVLGWFKREVVHGADVQEPASPL